MEGVEGGDNLVSAVAVLLAVLASKLEGALDGLCAAVAKEDSIQTAVVDEGLGQLELGDGEELVGGLDEGCGLFLYGLDHDGVAMTEVIDGPTGGEVQVFLAVGVPDAGTLASYEDYGLASDGLGVVFLFNGYPLGSHRSVPPYRSVV